MGQPPGRSHAAQHEGGTAMSKKRDLRFAATVAKSIIFVVVTVLATTVLAGTIRNSSSGTKTEYRALFSDATSLNEGDDVRVSGVKVGTVTGVEVAEDRLAEVTFTVSRDVDLTEGTSAELRFRNVVGQRYLHVELQIGRASCRERVCQYV